MNRLCTINVLSHCVRALVPLQATCCQLLRSGSALKTDDTTGQEKGVVKKEKEKNAILKKRGNAR